MRDARGDVQQSREEMEVLFLRLAERYERGSVLLSSNLPFSGWEAIFKDPMTTAAAIDRLVHHAVILELNIPSYRAEQARKAKQSRASEEVPAAGSENPEGTAAKPSAARGPRAPPPPAPPEAPGPEDREK